MDSFSWSLCRYQEKHCEYAEKLVFIMHQNPEKILSHRKLVEILSLYEKWWIFVDKFRSEPFERSVIHYIAERAFWSGVTDGEFVSKVLKFLYQVDNHFAFFLCPNGENSKSFLHWFLTHAYRQHLTINGRRILDLEVFYKSLWMNPCEVAVVTESPALLQILLQFGALIGDETLSLRRFQNHQASGKTLTLLVCIIRTITELFETDSTGDKYKDIVKCGRLILRACPQLEKSKINGMAIEFPGFPSPRQAFDWIMEHGLPEFGYRIYHPLPLMHACRLKIRRMLYDTWQLPFGIEALSIPTTLKDYLNLHYD